MKTIRGLKKGKKNPLMSRQQDKEEGYLSPANHGPEGITGRGSMRGEPLLTSIKKNAGNKNLDLHYSFWLWGDTRKKNEVQQGDKLMGRG